MGSPSGYRPGWKTADPQASLALHVHPILAHSHTLAPRQTGCLAVTTCRAGRSADRRAMQCRRGTTLRENAHSPPFWR